MIYNQKKSSVYYLNVMCLSLCRIWLPDQTAFVGSVSSECSICPRAIMKTAVFAEHFRPEPVVLSKRLVRYKSTI